MTSSFNLPEYDETLWYGDTHIPYPFDIDSIKYRSPSLPLHFDKQYLPSKCNII